MAWLVAAMGVPEIWIRLGEYRLSYLDTIYSQLMARRHRDGFYGPRRTAREV